MQNNDNLITLSIIRSLQDMELESFKVYAQQRPHFEQMLNLFWGQTTCHTDSYFRSIMDIHQVVFMSQGWTMSDQLSA